MLLSISLHPFGAIFHKYRLFGDAFQYVFETETSDSVGDTESLYMDQISLNSSRDSVSPADDLEVWPWHLLL